MSDKPDKPAYPALKASFAEEMAACIAALVNSKPASPTPAEMQAALLEAMGTHWTVHAGYEWAPAKEQRTAALMRELWQAVIEEWEERAEIPAFAPTAALAKRLARKDRPNHDDIYHVTIGLADSGPAICARKTVSLSFPIQPEWALYVDRAREALADRDSADELRAERRDEARAKAGSMRDFYLPK